MQVIVFEGDLTQILHPIEEPRIVQRRQHIERQVRNQCLLVLNGEQTRQPQALAANIRCARVAPRDAFARRAVGRVPMQTCTGMEFAAAAIGAVSANCTIPGFVAPLFLAEKARVVWYWWKVIVNATLAVILASVLDWTAALPVIVWTH